MILILERNIGPSVYIILGASCKLHRKAHAAILLFILRGKSVLIKHVKHHD